LSPAKSTRATKGRRHRPLLEAEELFVGAKETGAPLTYWNAEQQDLATVAGSELTTLAELFGEELMRRTSEAWQVTDDHGPVFFVRRYAASDHPAYDVVDPGGDILATFLCEGGLLHEEVLVRDEATAPVAELQTHGHLHELRELHGPRLASCGRVFDPAGNDPYDEVWSVRIEPDAEVLDRRALVAAPLVCHLTGHPKRHIDPDCAIAVALLVTVPPVGAVLIGVERALDGLYWLRRKLD
jgi:hypothetical protein